MARVTTFKNVKEMFDRVKDEVEKENTRGDGNFSIVDAKFWKPVLPKDKDKITYKIRFLPNPFSETGKPYVRRKLHAFGPDGNKLFENCRRVVGGKCYLCEQVNPLFDSENPLDKEKAMSRFAKKRYVSNIMVIDDPREDGTLIGKVYMFEHGVKIYEKLDKAIQSDFPYYDVYEGADFNLEVKKVNKWVNYDGSEFSRKSTKLVDGDEEKLEEIANRCYDLEKEILSEDNYNSYEEGKLRYIAWEKGDEVPKFNNKKKKSETEKTEDSKKDDSESKDEKKMDILDELEKAAKTGKEDKPKETSDEDKPKETPNEDDDFNFDEFEKELEEEFGK